MNTPAKLACAAWLAALLCTVQAQEIEEQAPSPPQELVAVPEAPQDTREIERGLASWYGPRFHGRRTASGEVFDMHALTAAHPRLPFGSVVRVRSLVNGKTVDVRINDRGPHVRKRVLDLSRAAAQALGLLDAGTGTKPVTISLVAPSEPLNARRSSRRPSRLTAGPGR